MPITTKILEDAAMKYTEYTEYIDYGCGYYGKFIKDNPGFDNEEFKEFVIGKNKADRDSGELADIAKFEIERLALEFTQGLTALNKEAGEVAKQQPELVWQKWQRDKTKANMGALLDTFRPMIQKEVTRHSGQLPQSYLDFEAKKLVYGAFETFDPSIAKLSTHVAHKLRGLGRVNYTYRNAIRMPEERQRKYSMFTQAKDTLRERFGRDPSGQELSEELLWAPDEVGRMEGDVHRETSDVPGVELLLPDNFLPRSKVVVDYLYHDMSPEEKIVFEGITGYNGHPILGHKGLAQKLNMSESQVRRRRDKLVEKLGTLLENYL